MVMGACPGQIPMPCAPPSLIPAATNGGILSLHGWIYVIFEVSDDLSTTELSRR